jgi:hypothetical protein
MTRVTRLVVVLTLIWAAACGGDGTTTTGPTPAPGESSFLTGTWRGTVTIHREGLPDTTGTTTWTFALVPNTGQTTFQTTIAVEHPWLPITTSVTTSVIPATPGGHISTVGLYPSPRGCQGALGSAGTAYTDRIEASFEGSDCQQLPETSVFSGTVTMTKSR